MSVDPLVEAIAVGLDFFEALKVFGASNSWSICSRNALLIWLPL
jgi:hypothetical protein